MQAFSVLLHAPPPLFAEFVTSKQLLKMPPKPAPPFVAELSVNMQLLQFPENTAPPYCAAEFETK